MAREPGGTLTVGALLLADVARTALLRAEVERLAAVAGDPPALREGIQCLVVPRQRDGRDADARVPTLARDEDLRGIGEEPRWWRRRGRRQLAAAEDLLDLAIAGAEVRATRIGRLVGVEGGRGVAAP
eukprot:SAG11_NODE_157_length_14147_cov_8.545202_19_plen_128_part_00